MYNIHKEVCLLWISWLFLAPNQSSQIICAF